MIETVKIVRTVVTTEIYEVSAKNEREALDYFNNRMTDHMKQSCHVGSEEKEYEEIIAE